jgi:hypothetical protein
MPLNFTRRASASAAVSSHTLEHLRAGTGTYLPT